MAWAFWRGSSSQLDHLSLSATRGCLFGQPLSSVCMEDALPKPVMVSCSESKSAQKIGLKFNSTPFYFFFSFYSFGSC